MNEKIRWPKSPSMKQYFSLSPLLIYYIAKNPSTPKCYNKLIQTCKYFFEKLPLLTVRYAEDEIICTNEIDECWNNFQKCCVKTDITKVFSQIWLTEFVTFCYKDINLASKFCSKVFRCEIDEILLVKNMTFEDFKFLASNAKKFDLYDFQIIRKNGNLVLLDSILEVVPNVEEFFITFNPDIFVVTAFTLKKIANLQNLKTLAFYYIPDIFNVDDLSSFILGHKDIHIYISFDSDISVEYGNQLDRLIDDIIKNDCHCMIEYYGQDEEKLTSMKKHIDALSDESLSDEDE
uniref:DUF38 domain-containing protein n=1 Tax=Panagrolaimus sp. ES5 TaxID=591445 RepID=A0AC34FI99_9BILA